MWLALHCLLATLSLLDSASGIPLCLNKEAPLHPQRTLPFCSQPEYASKGCCSRQDDKQISRRFQKLNISDAVCASHVKEILCAQCDPFASDLYGDENWRSVPMLCNNTVSSNNSSAATFGYCSVVWQACKHVSILNSPFSPVLGNLSVPVNAGLSKAAGNNTLTDQWESETQFCTALGANGKFCYNGKPYEFSPQESEEPPKSVCLEKVEENSYLSMVPHPDGTDRVFLANQQGVVWLANMPEEGSSGPINLNKSSPFLDISSQVVNNAELGFMSLAFHPNFLKNGRFFVSYNCDRSKWSGCGGRCSCNSDVDCSPALLVGMDTSSPCQYSSVIAEYKASSEAVLSNSQEITRILTMGLPFSTHHGGLMLFGPRDKYLYFMMGDGGSKGDPFNFAQNKKSLLGKILRLDIDKPSSSTSGVWGNYGIPNDNPFVDYNGSQPEIWALGFRNPWRCSFDSLKPEYLYCSDGATKDEEVNLVTKGGNYGWRVYDGYSLYHPSYTPGGNTSAKSIHAFFPIAGYPHDIVNKGIGSASLIGGSVSRSVEDACVYGRYLFADLYGSAMFTATERPEGSGNYTSARIDFICSPTSPYPCGNNSAPQLGYIFAWGEDNRQNVYVLTSNGVFKIVKPNKCNLVCNKTISAPPSSQPSRSPSAQAPSASDISLPSKLLLLFVSFLCLTMVFYS